ncbi:hypothetical protein [Nonomuraea sp. NPDC050540]|uniref:hypothetical protein n=1 Tax=Nonomuraea sp. NPDC050540 TaxID=3364367 RepID=UPI0037969C93
MPGWVVPGCGTPVVSGDGTLVKVSPEGGADVGKRSMGAVESVSAGVVVLTLVVAVNT